MREILLDIPFCHQKTDSACCGPCCIKMLLDFYGIKKSNGKEYTKQSLIALAKTDKEYGTQFRAMNSLLRLVELSRVKLQNEKEDIMLALESGHPVLTVIPDQDADHYVVIRGFTKNEYILADPYYGISRTVKESVMHKMIQEGGRWVWEIYAKS